jgi:Integrase core domain
MTAKPVAFLLADLGVTKSHSRPHCSNDNPYSESQFRTMKYRPEFPDRFGSYQDAHAFCGRFFRWYNDQHRHSGIGFHTPADVHYGRAELVRARRADVLSAAYAQHPERFVRKPPTPPALPTAVWINQPKEDPATTQWFPRNAALERLTRAADDAFCSQGGDVLVTPVQAPRRTPMQSAGSGRSAPSAWNGSSLSGGPTSSRSSESTSSTITATVPIGRSCCIRQTGRPVDPAWR